MDLWLLLLTILSSAICNKSIADTANVKQELPFHSTANERIDRYRTLLLEYFDAPRHPFINEDNWLYARTGVIKELKQIINKVPNVTMEMQDFHTDIMHESNESATVEGQNIIVTFHGRNRGTSNDEILLVGAHYDSDNTGPLSLNDNGSGVVAMLEVVRGLASAIVNKRVVLLNTVIFVAFDVQRFEHELVGEVNQTTGSTFYVNQKLSIVLNTEPKPRFIGAIILDAVMNYNRSKNSQVLPNGFDKSFPDAYETIKESNYVGNYMNMIVNEKLKSERLGNLFSNHWKETDSTERYPLMELDIRREFPSPALLEFIRQDHVAFWNSQNDRLPAILITDIGKWRGIRKTCGLNWNMCRGLSFMTPKRLKMLDYVVLTIDSFISNSSLITEETTIDDDHAVHSEGKSNSLYSINIFLIFGAMLYHLFGRLLP